MVLQIMNREMKINVLILFVAAHFHKNSLWRLNAFQLQLCLLNQTRQIHYFRFLQNADNSLKTNTIVVNKPSLKRANQVQNLKSLDESDRDIILHNKKITSLARVGKIEDARQVFDKMSQRSIVSWNAMITGYVCNGRITEARGLFDEMPQRNVASWNAIVSGYIRNERLEIARKLFDKTPERDIVSWNAMISGYARRGCMEDAQQLFDKTPERNIVSWNAMLLGYFQIGKTDNARHVFDRMPERDVVSWNMMITAYAQNGRMWEARSLFDAMPERNVVSWNMMITGYAQIGEVWLARQLFDRMSDRDVVTWTAMVAGYAQNGYIGDARQMFDKMPDRNIISWNAMISGYAQNGRMEDASNLFHSMPAKNVASWSAMIAGYSQNGQIEESRRVFDEMPSHDSLSWTSMIAGYSQNDHGEEALKLFCQMKHSIFRPIESTFTCVFSACANLAALQQGKQLHGLSIKTGFEASEFVGNTIITMYCKCGSVDDAYSVFDKMPRKDVIPWNAIIGGYAQHGYGKEALELFEQMQDLGIRPNQITLVGVLSACSYTGLVTKGLHYFHSITTDYGITPTSEHYTCIVDLLGRAGRLVEAEEFVNNMPIEPSARVWGALLGASRIYGNMELGQRAAEHIFELEPHNAGMYVLLCNMYAAVGRRNDATNLRVMMKERGVKKEPGCSWIEVKNKIHAFLVGDRSHPQSQKIYEMLDRLAEQLKEAGYVPLTNSVLYDVD